MVIDDGRILRLLELVAQCIEAINDANPILARGRLEDLKYLLERTAAEATPR